MFRHPAKNTSKTARAIVLQQSILLTAGFGLQTGDPARRHFRAGLTLVSGFAATADLKTERPRNPIPKSQVSRLKPKSRISRKVVRGKMLFVA
jgi:hypothetical protein